MIRLPTKVLFVAGASWVTRLSVASHRADRPSGYGPTIALVCADILTISPSCSPRWSARLIADYRCGWLRGSGNVAVWSVRSPYAREMSATVAAGDLRETLSQYGIAYLITVGGEARPHAVQVCAELCSGRFVVPDAGSRTRRNIADHRAVTLLWPPLEPGGYTLLVDGAATVAGNDVEIVVERAVLHRPSGQAVVADAGGCGSDCRPISVASVSVAGSE